jgi:hypothetical protein
VASVAFAGHSGIFGIVMGVGLSSIERWRQPVRPAFGVLLLLAAFAVGCGGSEVKRVAVRGTVTDRDGQPVPAGSIQFLPEEGTGGPASAIASIDEEGRYELDRSRGPSPGRNRIMVRIRPSGAAAEEDKFRAMEGKSPPAMNQIDGTWQFSEEVPDEGNWEYDVELDDDHRLPPAEPID